MEICHLVYQLSDFLPHFLKVFSFFPTPKAGQTEKYIPLSVPVIKVMMIDDRMNEILIQ